MIQTHLDTIEIWGVYYTCPEFEESFHKAKEIESWNEYIDNISSNIKFLVEYIIEQITDKNLDLVNLSIENFLYEIKNHKKENLEFISTKEIIDNLINLHELYINEIKAWNTDIINEKDHINCDFAIYLESIEGNINDDYTKFIVKWIESLHESFHDELKNFFEKEWNNSTFFSYIDNHLLSLKETLESIKRHEVNAFIDSDTWLANFAKLKKDIENLKISQLYLIKINKFSNIISLVWDKKWDKVITEIVNHLYKALEWFDYKLYRTWLEFWLILNSNTNFWDFINKNMKFNINIDGIRTPILIELSVWHAVSNQKLYDKALIALYESKKKWVYVDYSEELWIANKEKMENKLFWLNEINEAIKNGNIKAYFQWIRDNKTWEINKYETLVRIEKDWKVHSAALFIDIAKEYRLIWEITKIMIHDAICKIKETWFSFSVNITETDLNDKKIMAFIEESIKKSKIDPSNLIMEVLENITEVDTLYDNITKLKGLGIKIAIDDFGTWFSNFVRILKLKPDFLKIDGSLIKWIHENEDQQDAVKSIVDFAHRSWAEAVAEFVAKKEYQRIVEELWIEYSQWYLFSEPSKDIIESKVA